MVINKTKVVQVIAKSMHLYMKVRDQFECQIKDDAGDVIKDYEGYVPSFMPGDHYGDYLILDIDLETGQITNWNQVSKPKLKAFIEAEKDKEGDED